MPVPTRLRWTLATLGVLLTTQSAYAKIACVPLCDIPSLVVGSPSGASLPSCTPLSSAGTAGIRFVMRDFANVPIPGRSVVLNFSRSSIRLRGDDRPGTTVDCAARTITRVTDMDGTVVFAPRFSGPTAGATVAISCEGVPIATLPALSTDVDGNGVTGAEDLALLAVDLLSGAVNPATDFDPCTAGSVGRTTLSDLVLFAEEYLKMISDAPCP